MSVTVTCEQCKRTVAYGQDYNWLHLEYRPGDPRFPLPALERQYDFCSVSHMVEFYTGGARKRANARYPNPDIQQPHAPGPSPSPSADVEEGSKRRAGLIYPQGKEW
jgi:hypothetical protein